MERTTETSETSSFGNDAASLAQAIPLENNTTYQKT